jgi:pimeloyl-ACP methyl ester carboxylesterase
VLAIDGPGHGKSGRDAQPMTLDDCVDAATAVLDAAGLSRVAWLGLSWGGMVGMRLAARQPRRVARLALLDTTAGPEDPLARAVYRALTGVAKAVGPIAPLGRALVPLFFAPETRARAPFLVDDFVERLERVDPRALAPAVRAVNDRDDVHRKLARVAAPTLVIAGERDRPTPVAEAQRLATALPRATLRIVEGAGHLSALERPDVVTPFIERLLADFRG